MFHKADAKRLDLPGRISCEILSGKSGSRLSTLRLVEIAPAETDKSERGPHVHSDVEECIFVLSGRGTTHTDAAEYPLGPGDTILIPAGESHMTRNTGSVPLVLLCFFPSADIRPGTHEEKPNSRIPPKP